MDRKSSDDGEVKDGSSNSSSLEVTEPMETVTRSVLGKHGAESPEESSGDSEGENSEEDSDSVPEWGYDSFEDREYDPSKEEEYAGNEEELKWLNYKRVVIESKGFFRQSETAGFPHYRFTGLAVLYDLEAPAGGGLTVRQFLSKLTSLCLERYNEEKGLNVKLDHIVRANWEPNPRSKFYITFAARVSDDHPLVEYQAKAFWDVGDKSYPIFCRPSPPPQKQGS